MPASDVERGRNDRELLLSGLDGANPLAFLAAVGTLRTVSLAEPKADWRMKWLMHEGVWAPVLLANRPASAEAVVELLCASLRRESTPEFDFSQNLKVKPEDFRAQAAAAQDQARPQDRRFADFIAAFGCETLQAKDRKTIQDTALRALTGAGHQPFLDTMRKLVAETEAGHLRSALFETWSYADFRLGLRWDPEEDRRYALRWENPSDSDGVRTVRGANRLAVEALPVLPTVPGERELQTTGFTTRARAVLFTWPIWEVAVGVDVVRSLLALPEIQQPEPNRKHLNAMGVVEVHRSQRISIREYRNFTRALPA